MAGRPPSKPETIKGTLVTFVKSNLRIKKRFRKKKKETLTLLTLNFKGGEGLVDNLASSEGGRLPRWYNLKNKKWVKSKNLEIYISQVVHLEDASLLLSPNGILSDAEKAAVVF